MPHKIKRFPILRKTAIKEAIESGKSFVEYEEDLPVNILKGTLIDFETTERKININSQILSFGVVNKNKIKIIQLLNDSNPEQFTEKIKEEIRKLDEPFFAYMADYEKSFLDDLGIHIEKWVELNQSVPFIDGDGNWQEFGGAKLKKEYHIHIPGINFGEGKMIPLLWKHYNLTNEIWDKAQIIYDIIRHNRQCLIKELCILITGEEENIKN